MAGHGLQSGLENQGETLEDPWLFHSGCYLLVSPRVTTSSLLLLSSHESQSLPVLAPSHCWAGTR